MQTQHQKQKRKAKMSKKNDSNPSKRQADISWDDWDGKVKQPDYSWVLPTAALPVAHDAQKGGEHITKADLVREAEENMAKMRTDPKLQQPTDEQLFGHLVVTEEDEARFEEEYQTRISKMYTMPENSEQYLKKHEGEPEQEWKDGMSFNDMLSPEEVKKRNRVL